jgi:hypothetical protein
VGGDLFGGISGLDYDAEERKWYFVSDDRSEHSPARFFTAELQFDSHHFPGLALLESKRFRYADPTSVAPRSAAESIDAESLRLEARHGDILVASEGDEAREIGPWIRRVDRSGRWLGQISLPAQFGFAVPMNRGPRPNRSIEGIALDATAGVLWIALETPLLQDGPAPDLEHGADVRFTRLKLSDGTSSQYVYPTDVAHAHGPGEWSDNGVSEILLAGRQELLVLERSGIKDARGEFRFHTRLYCARWNGASDVAQRDSLAHGRYRKMNKRLVFDFQGAVAPEDGNLEGMAWGPRFADGHRSLVLVNDNNFFAHIPTQFVLFEVEQ